MRRVDQHTLCHICTPHDAARPARATHGRRRVNVESEAFGVRPVLPSCGALWSSQDERGRNNRVPARR
jgi:hypothetical protein